MYLFPVRTAKLTHEKIALNDGFLKLFILTRTFANGNFCISVT